MENVGHWSCFDYATVAWRATGALNKALLWWSGALLSVNHAAWEVWKRPKAWRYKFIGNSFISHARVAGDEHLISNGFIRLEIIIDVFISGELNFLCMIYNAWWSAWDVRKNRCWTDASMQLELMGMSVLYDLPGFNRKRWYDCTCKRRYYLCLVKLWNKRVIDYCLLDFERHRFCSGG